VNKQGVRPAIQEATLARQQEKELCIAFARLRLSPLAIRAQNACNIGPGTLRPPTDVGTENTEIERNTFDFLVFFSVSL
jgi:hypothetical protein